MSMEFKPDRPVGHESAKLYAARCESGFWARYVRGSAVLDIGYRGHRETALPIVEGAIGVERGEPEGYDGLHLPFRDGCVDTVHASHVLEHVQPPEEYLREWFRVLRLGGTIILMVPHAYLYERRTSMPSRWSIEHMRAYTPARLLAEIEGALEPNSWRLRYLADHDEGYDYGMPTTLHPLGSFEITCVIERIQTPKWKVEP